MTAQRLVRVPVLVAALFLASTCQRTNDGGAAVPHLDNHPPAETSDGRTVGADDKSPQHLLAEQGTSSHPAPGWKIGPNGVSYDPKRSPDEAKGATKIVLPDAGAETVPPAAAPVVAPVPEE
jgi:hypothetical protein